MRVAQRCPIARRAEGEGAPKAAPKKKKEEKPQVGPPRNSVVRSLFDACTCARRGAAAGRCTGQPRISCIPPPPCPALLPSDERTTTRSGCLWCLRGSWLCPCPMAAGLVDKQAAESSRVPAILSQRGCTALAVAGSTHVNYRTSLQRRETDLDAAAAGLAARSSCLTSAACVHLRRQHALHIVAADTR